MSLNRCEQALFDYWERNLDERRHWQARTLEAARGPAAPADVARGLARELGAYLVERRRHVPGLREFGGTESLLNLAELMVRLWGPLPKPKPPGGTARRG